MMFRFNANLAIVIHGDCEYDLDKILKKEPESKTAGEIKEYLKKRSG
jgi:hypothetical protein